MFSDLEVSICIWPVPKSTNIYIFYIVHLESSTCPYLIFCCCNIERKNFKKSSNCRLDFPIEHYECKDKQQERFVVFVTMRDFTIYSKLCYRPLGADCCNIKKSCLRGQQRADFPEHCDEWQVVAIMCFSPPLRWLSFKHSLLIIYRHVYYGVKGFAWNLN